MAKDKGKAKAKSPSSDRVEAGILYDFAAVQDSLYSSLVNLTRTANACPEASDLAFVRSMDKDVKTRLDRLVERGLATVDALYSKGVELCPGPSPQKPGMSSKMKKGSRQDMTAEKLARHPAFLTDLVDNMLEQTNFHIDVHLGKRLPTAERASALPRSKTKIVTNDPNLEKPQKRFLKAVDNSEVLIKDHDTGSRDDSDVKHLDAIRSIVYPQDMFTSPSSVPVPDSLAETKFVYIDTADRLTRLVSRLHRAAQTWRNVGRTPVIAVDLEHHSLRSYQGITCLMQLTMASLVNGKVVQTDYIIDTLVPEVRQNMGTLSKIFADASIVKVLHGAESDVIWLQRDFDLYVVNLFDTYHATNILELEGHSLAYLLKTLMDHDSDKRYQLADWRMRPIPEAMLEYARYDTHYLLAVYDRLRQALLARGQERLAMDSSLNTNYSDLSRIPEIPVEAAQLTNQHGKAGPYNARLHPMHAVLSASNVTALKRYKPESYDFEEGSGTMGWARVLLKGSMGRPLGPTAFEIFKKAHQWRDTVAREMDESPHYILSNFSLFNLAERQPTSVAGVLAACQPSSPIVRARVDDLIAIVQRVQQGLAADKTEADKPTIPLSRPSSVTYLNPRQNTSSGGRRHGADLEDDDATSSTEGTQRLSDEKGLKVTPYSRASRDGVSTPLNGLAELDNSSGTSLKIEETDATPEKETQDQTDVEGFIERTPMQTSMMAVRGSQINAWTTEILSTIRCKISAQISHAFGLPQGLDASEKDAMVIDPVERDAQTREFAEEKSTEEAADPTDLTMLPQKPGQRGAKPEGKDNVMSNAETSLDEQDDILYIGSGLKGRRKGPASPSLGSSSLPGRSKEAKASRELPAYDFSVQDAVLKLPAKPLSKTAQKLSQRSEKRTKDDGQKEEKSPLKGTPSKKIKLTNSAPAKRMTFVD